MSIKTAAQAIVDYCAPQMLRLTEDWQKVALSAPLVATLQRELALDGDRTDLVAEMQMRRASDTAENMTKFRGEFWRLAMAYRHANGQDNGGEFEALSMLVFGDVQMVGVSVTPPKTMLLDTSPSHAADSTAIAASKARGVPAVTMTAMLPDGKILGRWSRDAAGQLLNPLERGLAFDADEVRRDDVRAAEIANLVRGAGDLVQRADAATQVANVAVYRAQARILQLVDELRHGAATVGTADSVQEGLDDGKRSDTAGTGGNLSGDGAGGIER